ncbi:MAG: hypothetical protein K940chlam2_01306 [Chlamydiae bacterium]|nr:hypothetical protein [Chlamydiota bacterium]
MPREKPIVLVTGVAGRIGSKVARIFAPFAHVVGLDICHCEGESDFIPLDLSSDESVKKALDEVSARYGRKIASVIHLAAYYNFAGGMWERYEAITIEGTRRLLNQLQNFEVEQFLFASTLLVYAPTRPGDKIVEDSPIDANWEYPLSKIKTEALIREMGSNMQTTVLRIAGVYDDYCHSIPISQHIMRIYHKELESHFFPGDSKRGAPFLHMDDLVDAIQRSYEKRAGLPRHALIVLGEEKTLSFQDLQTEIGLLLHGTPWKTIRIPKWFAKMGAQLREKMPFLKKSFIKPWMVPLADMHHELDTSYAKELLGWEPCHSLGETLPKMVDALRQSPEEWLHTHRLHEK